jgi:hypothetical protein
MAEKTAAEKMRLKPGMAAAVLHAPLDVMGRLGVPDDVTVVDDPAAADFVLVFAETQAEAEKRLRALAPHVGEGTLVWLAYPKGSKAAGRDLSRDTLWAFARTIGLDLVANVAVDEKWSALRLRRAK